MKVKALIGFAGIGFSVAKGEVRDLPDAIAESAVMAGHAEAVSEAKPAVNRTKKNESKRTDHN